MAMDARTKLMLANQGHEWQMMGLTVDGSEPKDDLVKPQGRERADGSKQTQDEYRK